MKKAEIEIEVKVERGSTLLGLGTRQLVRELVTQRFGVRLHLASIGAILARQGLTPQKPLPRAYQRDPAALARWPRDTYPAIARPAKRAKAESSFGDESGCRADAVQGTTWEATGQTPGGSVPGQCQGISAASAVSSKGAFWFLTYPGGLNGESFITRLRRMRCGRRRPVPLMLDGLPAHKTKAATQYVAGRNGKLMLHDLPGSAPDFNPDELVWSHATRTGTARRPRQQGETLNERVIKPLAQIGRRPRRVRSCFRHPSVA